MFASVESEIQQRLLQQLGFTQGVLPVRYLGVPLIASKLSITDCNPIIEKVKKKLEKWSVKTLTYAGRLQLISSVIFHYQTYWSMIFVLPKTVLNHIEAMCRKFMWSGKLEKNAIALVAWNKVCVPKEEGGLALKQLKVWNLADVGHKLWKVIAGHQCLWTRWVRQVYLKQDCIWTVPHRVNDPWTWRKVLKLRSNFAPYIKTVVGDGRETNLFFDRWLEVGPIIDMIGADNNQWGKNIRVADWRCNGEWSIPRTFKRRYPDIAEGIQAVALTQQKDRVIWIPNMSKHYTIDSFHKQVRVIRPRVNWHRLVWTGKLPQKYKFCLWLLAHQKLKTRELLQGKGMVINSTCVFCNAASESCQHLFFACSYTNAVWKSVLGKIGNVHRNPGMWGTELAWLRTVCKGRNRSSKQIQMTLLCIVYNLWGERNNRIFRQESKDEEGLINLITRTISMIK